MAFLDNSGDIILDAVLTDTGRMRLARADGSFKIVKFALGDDEINYENYNLNHASGSSYYDLEVLQTPILEAFTNNSSLMKSKLISMSRNDLLYLPVLKWNQTLSNTASNASGSMLVAVDTSTEAAFAGGKGTNRIDGLIYGASRKSPYRIRVDQGIDAVDSGENAIISPASALDADLVETQYMIQIDNRFGNVRSVNDNLASVSFVDDDNIASYYFSLGTDLEIVKENTSRKAGAPDQVIAGPRGTICEFQIQSSLELNTSNFLFQQLGSTLNMYKNDGKTVATVYYIDSTVRIQGATTGYSLDLPVRFIKLV